MTPFAYEASQLAKVQALLSKERFEPYLKEANGDAARALKLYERNTILSESLYGLLQGLEVAVRNSMHEVLTARFGADWYYHSVIVAPETEKVSEARQAVLNAGKTVTPGQIVAALSFGFWVALTQKKYARSLWVPCLHKAFPHKAMNHMIAHQRLRELRDLRNRVAHHEPIWRRKLKADLALILDTIAWICPETSNWQALTNTLKDKIR